ncbi:hypothetical protein N5079_16805 [Planotetraspora sp. A-T 1434]|uniref:hypothetical protein n=1 Tax=Planotetraspora sp. A-T 1434 TaxID=2979219 RepID=UPI0021C15459|nr:hypothetical protein [Planotetraspora sp. A-T 1434]MCT9931870.1 hypothetical protein [Planotetraspora sp. A-T 1434]
MRLPKDALFLAVVERIRVLFGARMRTPAECSGQPSEAVVRYCGRFVQLLRWSSVARMLRLGIAEADRLRDLAAGPYDVLFGITVGNLAAHLVTALGLAADVPARFAPRWQHGWAFGEAECSA